MQKSILLISLLMIVGLTGCLEISETIKINKDKSGSISYELKSGNTANFLNKISGLFDISIEEQAVKEAEKFIHQLRKQEGISNIQQNFDSRRGLYSLSFDFKNSKYFNEALYHLAGSKKNIFTPGYIKVKDSRFKKINFSPWLKRYLKKENIVLPDIPLTDLITFTSVVELPSKIVRVKPKDVIIAQHQKEAKQKFKFIEITSGKARTRIRIKFEN